ncbi:acyltransferase family protein [Williamsia sp.]|uniref:acyltransferase family protein n=1 Tax=Williamsia sp. TaxID=1872085 RepID=UPI0039C9B217
MSAIATGPSVASRPLRPAPGNEYRIDLDGLRGIAITLVAVFHIWFGRVSGGVDVFLTLSGYFFVASLLKHVLATSPATVGWTSALNPGPRLWRLARRLLPALLTVLLFIVVMCLLLMPRTRWAPLGSEVIASAFYYQNWHLALAAQDYAAADSANSPLQHLWSMSVQGQFFVVTLLAALALGGALKMLAMRFATFRRPVVVRSVVGVALLGVTLVSFAWAHHRHGINQPFNYYDTIARTWEPLAGGLLAVAMPRVRMPQWLRDTLGLIALGLIITCGWWIAGVQQYPSTMALVPVGATLLLIWSGSRQTAPTDITGPATVSSWLAHPSIVWLGSIAYALYLWHWPLLIFYLTWRYKDSVGIIEGAAIIVVSLVLAWTTTRFIEKPLRQPRPAPTRTDVASRGTRGWPRYATVLTSVLVVLTLSAGVSIAAWDNHVKNLSVDTENLDPRLYPGARAYLDGAPVPRVEAEPSPDVADMDWPITSYDSVISGWKDGSIRVGVYGDVAADRTIALVGGSHAEYWITALDAVGKQQGFKVTTYLKVGCPLTVDHVFTWFGQKYYQCNEWSRDVMDRLALDRPDVVFTNSTRPVEGEVAGDFVPSDYIDIFSEFRDRGQKVIAVRDNPWTLGSQSPPECLALGKKPSQCGVERSLVMATTDPALAIAPDFPNMSFLDYTDAMCDAVYCPAVVGNILVWHDFHHLSATFVRSLIPALGTDMQKVLSGWW